MSDPTATVLVDQPADGVLRLRLNRPQVRNALNTALRIELARLFTQIDGDPAVRCVILTGGDNCFAAGADLKEFAELGAAGVWRLDAPRHWKAIADCGKPVIAAVAGPALGGGCELAQHADIILAARSARFGQPEVTVGIMPGGGATQRLVRALGKYRAMKLLLSGEPISAEEALAMGLASELVEDDALEARAVELAQVIASRPPAALRLLKQVALAAEDTPLGAGLMLERRAFELLFDTADKREGMAAFAERRPAKFTGC